MKFITLCFKVLILSVMLCGNVFAQREQPVREHIKMDFGWHFAFGHPSDQKRDFDNGTSYFSYISKAGYGDGAASANFDDRSWRTLNLPHDWAVEAPFDNKGSHSHGYKAIGKNFPETSVGWYRKSFTIPASDFGRKIYFQFDGISRNSIVWVNGHYLGTEPSGYQSFEYDITDILNYGGSNVIAVRCDVTMEEGWFYEGAGIYRHAWLNKRNPLHVEQYGTFVKSNVKNGAAEITADVTIVNSDKAGTNFAIRQTIVDAQGKNVASGVVNDANLTSLESKEFSTVLTVPAPQLWSLESPYLYKLVTSITKGETLVDVYETTFGIRTIRFDANEGFFLNDKHVKLKGTNNHQDHAGVGTAIPDALQDFRIATLKSFGSNAYRCSHNPPTPELLDACDRLGMLVIDENRLMGTTARALNEVKRFMVRDRNHPSIIAWSIGNEEWAIEGNEVGARIASTMQQYVKTIDSTRPVNAAVSGGWDNGIATVIDVMGYNYLAHGSTDEHHKKFPNQPSMGTEEGSTYATRGIYFDDKQKQYIAAYDRKPRPDFYSIEEGWTHYANRNYLGGMFIWTGFDYRGESTPHGFPSVSSYFGMVDLCGFPKDNVYYLRSWWSDKPTLHIFPHWNWKGKEGETIDVWAYSNCDEVELFLNKKSLGKKVMPVNSHLEWKVTYAPGTLEAVGYKGGKKILNELIKTTGAPASIQMTSNKNSITADKEDISVITVQVNDKNNLFVPTADDEISFSIKGPGRIIGVGNGDPTSHEADKFIESIRVLKINDLREKQVVAADLASEIATGYDDRNWAAAFKPEGVALRNTGKDMLFRGSFELPTDFKSSSVTWFYKEMVTGQSLYINGKLIASNSSKEEIIKGFKLDTSLLTVGKNSIVVVGVPLKKKHEWDNVNEDPGTLQLVYAPGTWKRKLFNGLAQVIVQSTGEAGEILVTATSGKLNVGIVKVNATTATLVK